MYIYIGHESSLGVLSQIYQLILRKSETRPRADMIKRACPRKMVKEASAVVVFTRFTLDGARSRFSSGLCRYA